MNKGKHLIKFSFSRTVCITVSMLETLYIYRCGESDSVDMSDCNCPENLWTVTQESKNSSCFRVRKFMDEMIGTEGD